jgi:hypothetical protein
MSQRSTFAGRAMGRRRPVVGSAMAADVIPMLQRLMQDGYSHRKETTGSTRLAACGRVTGRKGDAQQHGQRGGECERIAGGQLEELALDVPCGGQRHREPDCKADGNQRERFAQHQPVSTGAGCAPMAMRIPISRERRITAYDMTP